MAGTTVMMPPLPGLEHSNTSTKMAEQVYPDHAAFEMAFTEAQLALILEQANKSAKNHSNKLYLGMELRGSNHCCQNETVEHDGWH